MKENIIYIRTSTKEQTPELQLKDLSTMVNIEDAEVLIDKQSAWKDNIDRDYFDKLVVEIKKNKIKMIYVWDLDRIYRNRKRLIEFFELCKIFKCKIRSYRQQWLDNFTKIPPPFDEIMYNLMLNIMGWLSEEESTKKSERIKMSIKKEDGITVSHKGNKWGRKSLTKNTVERIMYLRSMGKSIREISREVKVSIGAVHKLISKN